MAKVRLMARARSCHNRSCGRLIFVMAQSTESWQTRMELTIEVISWRKEEVRE